jgi:hypothetical protein
MHPDILAALARVGTHPDENGNVRLYHATTGPAADSIIADGVLHATESTDLAQRLVARGGGSVHLASSPSIAADLGKGQVVLAVDIPKETPAEVPPRYSPNPSRVELEVQLPPGEDLPLVFVDRLDRRVSLDDLPAEAQRAVEAFKASEVGQQLARIEEQPGRCQRASIAFLSALRHHGADGTLIVWSGPSWWHSAILVADTEGVIVDWTASQFESDEVKASTPYPRIETRAQADARWGDSDPEDIDTPVGRFVSALPELAPWSEAQRRIPDRETEPEQPDGS